MAQGGDCGDVWRGRSRGCLLGDPFDERGVHRGISDTRVSENDPQERDVGRDAEHRGGRKSPVECPPGRCPIGSPGDHLRQHRIVVGSNLRADEQR